MAKQKASGVPVSERALIQRINRKLAAQDEIVRTARGGRAEQDLGRYFIVDVRIGGVVHSDIDLEEWGRELAVLRSYERLVQD